MAQHPQTALRCYERLESLGLWRAHSLAKRREVLLVLRENTLEFCELGREQILGHWALSAITQIQHDEQSAVFSADPAQEETITLDDRAMIEALRTIEQAFARRRSSPSRTRKWLTRGFLIASLGALLWLPTAIIRHSATILPASAHEGLGQALLRDLITNSGALCSSTAGDMLLANLAQKLFPQSGTQIKVIRGASWQVAALPGELIVISRHAIETTQDPDYLLALIAAQNAPRIQEILSHIGLFETLRLISTGTLSEGSLRGYAAQYISSAPPNVQITQETPRISDRDWVVLQNICL